MDKKDKLERIFSDRNGAIVLVVFLIVIFVGSFIATWKKMDEGTRYTEFISLGTLDSKPTISNGYVFTSYEDYKQKIKSSQLSEEDFKKNHYVYFYMNFNSCREANVKPIYYQIQKENIIINVDYDLKCGYCDSQYLPYLLPVPKSMKKAKIQTEYLLQNIEDCHDDDEEEEEKQDNQEETKEDEEQNNSNDYHDFIYSEPALKPMIYLYPTETTDVTVHFEHPEKLVVSYPKYENEWNVTVHTDGTVIDKKSGRSFYGLYWEGRNHSFQEKEEGFVVERDKIEPFLEEKLELLGLNEREADEFIIYWLPILQKNQYNYIYFETTEQINEYMPMEITPKPDTVIRILMNFKPLRKKITIPEQKLVTPNRVGFTVVEWGGSPIA